MIRSSMYGTLITASDWLIMVRWHPPPLLLPLYHCHLGGPCKYERWRETSDKSEVRKHVAKVRLAKHVGKVRLGFLVGNTWKKKWRGATIFALQWQHGRGRAGNGGSRVTILSQSEAWIKVHSYYYSNTFNSNIILMQNINSLTQDGPPLLPASNHP